MSAPRLWKRVYRIGGSPLLAVHADSRAALDALELRHTDDPDGPRLPFPLEIFLLGGGIAGRARVESPEAADTVYSGEAVSILSRGGLHYGGWYGKAASVADPRTGRAVIRIPGLRHYNPDFISRHIFRPVLDRLLLDRGWLPLHSAACAAGERGCLLVGETGAGKTTLLLRLLEEGMGFFADDRALVREEGGRFRLPAFPERIRLALDAQGRKRSRPAPEPAVATAHAEMIFFLDPDRDGKPRAERIGAAEAAARLAQSVSPYLELRERKDLLPFIERLCRGAACCAVRGWGDPGERAALVGNLVREGMQQ
jgi:hypothetical protein